MRTEPEMIGKEALRALLKQLPDWNSANQNAEIEIIGSQNDTIQFLVSGENKLLIEANRRKTKEQLQSEVQVNSALFEAGCHLALPFLQNRDGRQVMISGNWRILIRPFIASAPQFNWLKRTWSSNHAYAAGKALFALHTTSKKIVPKLQTVVPDNHPVSYASSKMENLFANLEANELLSRLCESVNSIKNLLTAKTFAPVLIHGDFHPGNILYDGESVKAIIDFDSNYMYLGPAEIDCAYGALMFAIDWESPQTPSIDKELFLSFLQGYSSSGGHKHPDISYFDLASYLVLLWAMAQEKTGLSKYDLVTTNAINVLAELKQVLS
jgi:Ser/Thr protein kinase RdoA (MazF antagonist)